MCYIRYYNAFHFLWHFAYLLASNVSESEIIYIDNPSKSGIDNMLQMSDVIVCSQTLSANHTRIPKQVLCNQPTADLPVSTSDLLRMVKR